MNDPPEDRSALAVALAWVARITTVAGVMVVPGLLGYVVDQRLGTRAVFTIIGFGLGILMGGWSLIRVTRSARPEE